MSESDMCEFVVLIIFGVLLLCLLYFLIITLSPDTLPKQCPPRPGKILDSSRPAFALRSLHSFIIRIGGCSEYACPCGVFPSENTCHMCPICPNMPEYARICPNMPVACVWICPCCVGPFQVRHQMLRTTFPSLSQWGEGFLLTFDLSAENCRATQCPPRLNKIPLPMHTIMFSTALYYSTTQCPCTLSTENCRVLCVLFGAPLPL